MQVFIELVENNKEKLHWNLAFIEFIEERVSHFGLYEKALSKNLFDRLSDYQNNWQNIVIRNDHGIAPGETDQLV